MIGGQHIIKICSPTGQKVTVTTTVQSVKPGTFNKIIRALELQKQLVFNDFILNDNAYGAVTPIIRKTSSSSFFFLVDGTNTRQLVQINSADTIVYSTPA